MGSRRDGSGYMSLRMQASSNEAKSLITNIADQTWSCLSGKKRGVSRIHSIATGAFIADLLKAASRSSPCYRQMGRSSFTGERIGYRALKQVADGAEAAGLIRITKGTGGGIKVGEATRFNATCKLLQLAEHHGVDPSDWQLHFEAIRRATSISEPLILKSASKRVAGWKLDAVRMPFDGADPRVIALAQQVDELNTFFESVSIEPTSDHYSFHRIFNEGDTPGFAWNKGGRLYSIGDSYQIRKSVDRAKMKLNGEPVIEIDIQASHLTILHACMGKPLDPTSHDPYQHPSIPRRILKGWVVMTLGHNRFHRAWSADMIADYHERTGGKLGKDYPIKNVREEALKLFPLLKDWETCSTRWGDLQFIESCAVVDTVYHLAMEHEVPALPVHDSIIVPVSEKELASSVMISNFEKHVGVKPALSLK